MGETKLSNLKAKLAALAEKVEAEEKVEAAQDAIDKTRDLFSDALTAAILKVEKDSGESLRTIGIGIWVAYPANGGGDSKLMVSGLETGDDGLPAQLKRPSARVNGSNGANGDSEYVLGDGRVFTTCLDAVKALGLVVENDKGERLDGFKYYHRHDRLPDDVKGKITKRPKSETPAEPPAEQPANGTGPDAETAETVAETT
jgi:hypothetical protein